jgi:hypothetical protein
MDVGTNHVFWVDQAVARGQHMGVFPKHDSAVEDKQSFAEVEEHVRLAIKAVAKDQPAEKYIEILRNNYIREMDALYKMSKLELMHCGIQAGIAERLLHERSSSSDIAPEECPIPVMHTNLIKEVGNPNPNPNPDHNPHT